VPEATTMQVLDLERLLQDVTPSLRHAFLNALQGEGFEITHGIPNLLMPQEIDESIGWLANSRFGESWVRLHSTLSHAAADGTLVDLSYGTGGS